MIQISQLKLRPGQSTSMLRPKIAKSLHLKDQNSFDYEVVRESIDARKKPDIFLIYTVNVNVQDEASLLKKVRNDRNIRQVTGNEFIFSVTGEEKLNGRPVIIGAGPAGLFTALMLARSGFKPIVIERGKTVDKRSEDVEHFWATGQLNPESNVQFGEGGAGTFSDGKLNTAIKDPGGRIRFVIKNFVAAGADSSILYSFHPHVGTDVLYTVVSNFRKEIISLGGEFLFETRMDDFEEAIGEDGGRIMRLQLTSAEKTFSMDAPVLVLALGHSARDTFAMLEKRGTQMEPKPFAVGVRVQHPQQMINEDMYGKDCPYELPASSYKVTHRAKDERGVYSFCMCPGGYVVNASSEEGMTAVNGMSYADRAGENANSAIVVTISPDQYGNGGVLDGIDFQRELERKAYEAGQGAIPIQRFEDFTENRVTEKLGHISPCVRGKWTLSNVRTIFPSDIASDIEEGIRAFERNLKGFSDPDVLLAGVESRTSSPVRMRRTEQYNTEKFPQLYPCGEGAGYAGGITSAAMDGIRVAEAIARRYRP